MIEEKISPKKRYILRAIELSKTDAQLSRLVPNNDLRQRASADDLSLSEVISILLDGYADRPALGERKYNVVDRDGAMIRSYQSSFNTISYKELHHKIKAVSMAFRNSDLCSVQRDEFVMIMGFADTDFVTIDTAVAYAKAVRVPIQSSSSGADLSEIVKNIQPVLIATTMEDLSIAMDLAIQQGSIKSIVVFNYDDRVDNERVQLREAKDQLAKSKGAGKNLLTLEEVIKIGEQYPFIHLPNAKNEKDKRSAIIHSSGSTGKPKGAVVTQDAFIYRWIGQEATVAKITMLVAPLNHIMGRLNLMGVLNCGGTGYFTLKPDLSTLIEDIRMVRPTYLSLFPRVFEVVHQHFQNEVAKRKGKGNSLELIENEVMGEMRKTYLGDRLLIIIFGSAPTSKKVQDFMRTCFDVLLVEGYGNTESGSGSLTMDNKIVREIVTDYKLKDVPELGYFTTDKPHPRGELVVKTKYGIKEYYKQPEATAALFDEEGYSCTGDIVEEIAPDEIIVIDRRKDVLKLSHGEYVATGTLGTIFEANSALIHQIYVYGNSKRSYLLAIVVPEMEVLDERLESGYSENQIKNLIRDELNKAVEKEDLRKFEVPRDFIIEYEAFTQENGLLSSVRKRLRPALKKKYGAKLEAMYELHENAQDARVEALKNPDCTLSTVDKLIVLLENQLKIDGIEAHPPRSFTALGGDSLGAALFSMSIEELFDVSLPADMILSPNGSLSFWANYIEESQNSDTPNQITFAAIHGKGAVVAKEDDIQLAKFINEGLLQQASNLPHAPFEPQTVLLTGANGFLGHIVCLEWLKRLSKSGGKLICLVREDNNEAANEKLAKEFIGIDPSFEKSFKELSKNHLEVIAGDIGRPSLGLSKWEFERLSTEVDRICHVAALVNHRLAYQHLFGPNVVGTAEIIRLAISKTIKPIDFISTVGVFMLLDSANGINETTPFKQQFELSDKYASGYAASKWGGELLLKELNRRCGNPVNVFRCDMILPDRQYKGQANVSDMLTRLLYSVAITGLAPQTFYKNIEGEPPSLQYPGVTVDVLAKAIVRSYLQGHDGYKTYHAVNYSKDNISLDHFIDWIESYGYPIDRIENHADWYMRMETKLRSLPEQKRQLSALEVLMAYARPQGGGVNKVDTLNFQALVEDLDVLGKLPKFTESYIHKYMADMEALGMFS